MTNENELEFIGYQNWLNKKGKREEESIEVSRLRIDLDLLTFKVRQLEEMINQINKEFN
jgi:hypothetical protein